MPRTIQKGRVELAKERADREKMAAAAAQSLATVQVNLDPSKMLAASEPDAGQPLDPFGPGASVADLNKQNGGGAPDKKALQEEGTGGGGPGGRGAPSGGGPGPLAGGT